MVTHYKKLLGVVVLCVLLIVFQSAVVGANTEPSTADSTQKEQIEIQRIQEAFLKEQQEAIDEDEILPSIMWNVKAKDICTGGYTTTVIRDTGVVQQWGVGAASDPSSNPTKGRIIPFKPTSENNEAPTIKTLVCGDYYTLALTTDGQLWSWGRSEIALGHDTDNIEDTGETYVSVDPRQIEGALLDKIIVKAAAGSDHVLALTDTGRVYTWGTNRQGQTGQKRPASGNSVVKKPTLIRSSSIKNKKIVDICAGSSHSALLSDEGEVFTFGSSAYGKIGHAVDTDQPTKVEGVWKAFLSNK